VAMGTYQAELEVGGLLCDAVEFRTCPGWHYGVGVGNLIACRRVRLLYAGPTDRPTDSESTFKPPSNL